MSIRKKNQSKQVLLNRLMFDGTYVTDSYRVHGEYGEVNQRICELKVNINLSTAERSGPAPSRSATQAVIIRCVGETSRAGVKCARSI